MKKIKRLILFPLFLLILNVSMIAQIIHSNAGFCGNECLSILVILTFVIQMFCYGCLWSSLIKEIKKNENSDQYSEFVRSLQRKGESSKRNSDKN